MIAPRVRITVGFLSIFLITSAVSSRAKDFEWLPESPEKCGLDSVKLESMTKELAARGTKAVLIVRRDRIAWEWYSADHGPDRRHYTASLAKALVGGMSLLLALNDNRLEADDPAWKYIPLWKNDPLRNKITIRHLATHSSGIENAETEGKTHFEQSGWKLLFWTQEPDPFSMAVRQAPVIFEPGAKYHYSNPGMGALAYAVTASYKGTKYKDIRTLLKTQVMDRIGVAENAYSMGYGKTFELDGLKLVANWGGGGYTARATARVGRLMLRKGNWEGRQLIRPEMVEQVVSYAGTPLPTREEGNPDPASGLGWYTNYDGVWPRVPRDAFAGAGAGNQVMIVVPSLDMIVVRNGSLLDTSGKLGFWGGTKGYLFNPVMEAVIKPPCAKSETILGIEFEPVERIVRRAIDCDNWPITWADDGHMYTAYGDGWGFEPRTEKKLSNGLARITGGGEDFRGENIRTSEGETIGDGPQGAKASGMLTLDGTLYMLIRNVGNSQLVWSQNHGINWTYGFKFTESFGCPAFLNFGQNYEGARDNYVYVYSQDGHSAYEDYNGVVLARAPREKIRDRKAYEYFKGKNSAGNPLWSPDPKQRAHVFSFPGHCHRLDVVYNPGLGRYLMALAHNHQGSWGIYEACEPWGPWKKAFYTDYWGLGDTHGYRIPSKWIAADGKSFYLLFSGRIHEDTSYDAFCVRKARIITAPEE